MSALAQSILEALRLAPSVTIDTVDASEAQLRCTNSFWDRIADLFRESLVHCWVSSVFGDPWSVTKLKSILHIDASQELYFEAIENPKTFIVDHIKPRRHSSFDFDIHHCVGNRLAELQIKILWGEQLQRWPYPMQIEVMGEPKYMPSPLVKVHEALSVCIES